MWHLWRQCSLSEWEKIMNAGRVPRMLLASAFEKSVYDSVTGKCRGAKGCTHHHNGNLRRAAVVAWSRLVDGWIPLVCCKKHTESKKNVAVLQLGWAPTVISQISSVRFPALIFDIQVPDSVVWRYYSGQKKCLAGICFELVVSLQAGLNKLPSDLS